MGSRGPAPTPTELLQMRGSWRANARGQQPQPEYGRPACPSWLGEEERAIWEAVVPRLEAMRVLALSDCNALARYCRLMVRWRAADALLAERGETYVVRGEGGEVRQIVPLPHVAIARSLADQLLRLEQQFGLTPAARATLGMRAVGQKPDGKKGRKAKTKARFFVD